MEYSASKQQIMHHVKSDAHGAVFCLHNLLPSRREVDGTTPKTRSTNRLKMTCV
jgi:hypothetical protein